MAKSARPPARRRVWFDPRFGIGIVLVAASTAGVVTLLATADSTVQVMAARTTLLPGERVSADDLVPVSVRLPSAGQRYVGPSEVPPGGLLVSRVIEKGELVPSSAIGSLDGERLTSVVVSLSGRLAASIDAGSTVDVWASRTSDDGGFGPPAVLVPSALVVRIIEEEGFVVDRSTGAVELLVPQSRIARVLEAIANLDALALIPVGAGS